MNSSFSVPFSTLQAIAKSSGLALIGVSIADSKPLESSRLKVWQENGNAADMNYMLRDADLQGDPFRLLPESKSLISFAVSYDSRPAPKLLPGYGRVARYAWGKDYHLVLPKLVTRFASLINEEFGEFKYRIFSDAVPLLERAFAANSGLGFIGKNTMLIRPKIGSFTLIAEILCDFEVSGYIKPQQSSHCGSCRSCLDSCPTSAFTSEYVLDARKCISYLSIEKRGALSVSERKMLGEWVFGCDVCQEVCPFNHSPSKQQSEPEVKEFSTKFGAGPQLNLLELLKISDQSQFKSKFRETPLLRPKREGLLRNAVCVAVNTDYFEAMPQLKVLALEDPADLVRQFAFWGLAELAIKENGNLLEKHKIFLERGLSDNASEVVGEVQTILSSSA